MPKKIIIIAGPHGAGKTAFARAFLPEEAACKRFVNADMIAAGLSPFAPEEAATKAARLMLEEIHANVRRGVSFAFETTLSGLSYLNLIRQWQKAGYRVNLYFLALSSVEAAIARVAERVRQGGHPIPEEVIRRRFVSGLRNFERYYRGCVDAWISFDNLSDPPRFLELGENPTRSIIQRWSSAAWQYRLISTRTHAPPWRPKTHNDLAAASDDDMQKSLAALLRASQLARQTAIQTGTAIVVARKYGQFVRITAHRLEKQLVSIIGV